jgi:hypothetical protein
MGAFGPSVIAGTAEKHLGPLHHLQGAHQPFV